MVVSEEQTADRTLLTRVLQNTFWFFNSSILTRALNLLRGIILARLLLPEDFGLFGLASIVIGFTAMFSDVGAGVFLVYKQEKHDQDDSTAFWTNFIIVTLLTIGISGLAPLVGKFYGRMELVPVLIVLAVVLWLYTVSSVHRNLLRRELRLRLIAAIDAIVSIVSFISVIWLALKGYGVWAFVFSNLLANIVNVLLLFYTSRWLPKLHFSFVSFKKLAPFSGWYIGQAIVWYLILNMDNLLVGKFLGMSALGIYTLAYNYALLPITVVANSIGNVVFTELPRLYHSQTQFWAAFYKFSRLLLGSVCPIACVLIVSASDLFPVLFGAKWTSAILPFQILAFYGIVRCLWIDPFSALGYFNLSFWFGLLASILSFFGIYAGLQYGINGVALAVLIVVGCVHIAALYFVSRSMVRLKEGFQNALPFIFVGGVATFVALCIRYLFLTLVSSNKLFLVFVTITTIFLVYGLVYRRHLRDIISIIITKPNDKKLKME